MSIDLSQFLQTFFEESFEGIEVLESELIDLTDESDSEIIHTIFRAAHSIKGGSATFGLNRVAEFTHVMETLLGLMRDGKCAITKHSVDVLLKSVDVLKDLLLAERDSKEPDMERAKAQQVELERIVSGDDGGNASDTASDVAHPSADVADAQPKQGKTTGWQIAFTPHAELLKTGNEPVRMLRELDAIGELTTHAHFDKLPTFADLDPEACYIYWDLTIVGEIPREQIDEIFEWVEDECDLIIEALKEDSTDQSNESNVSSKPQNGTQTTPASTQQQGNDEALENNKSPIASDKREKSRRGVKEDRRANDRRSQATAASSIRVGTEKIDILVNMVGELVITQSMLSELGKNFTMASLDRLQDGLTQLERNTREMQESVMHIRMLPISFVFNRFPRMVHDLSQQLAKTVKLEMSGTDTELDKTVMEKIGDPLVHLVRNCLDHGLEPAEERIAAGKDATGHLYIDAYNKGGNIIIEIRDDGAGLPKARILEKAIENGLVDQDEELTENQINELIFHPGLSTAKTLSDVSGRGVGMDVVVKNIKALGGLVRVASEEGEGTTFTIQLPLTLAILDGQLLRVGSQVFILQLTTIIESIQIKVERLNHMAGKAELYQLRDDYIPIIRLHELFHVDDAEIELDQGLLVVVDGGSRKMGLFVNELLDQQQVVIKSLEANFKPVEGVAGATILGDGRVALILDMTGLIQLFQNKNRQVRQKLEKIN